MKRLQSYTLLTLFLGILLLICNINPANCLAANSMWIEPPTISFDIATQPVGYKFNVTVYTNLSVSSYAWQFYLTYNKNHLNATGCWYSAGAKSQWAGTLLTSPQSPSYGSHNATYNYVFFGESLQGATLEIPAGNYSLALVEFQIIAAPPEGQTFQNHIRLDIVGAFSSTVLDTDLNDIPLIFGSTAYTIIDEFSAFTIVAILILSSAASVLLAKKRLLK